MVSSLVKLENQIKDNKNIDIFDEGFLDELQRVVKKPRRGMSYVGVF